MIPSPIVSPAIASLSPSLRPAESTASAARVPGTPSGASGRDTAGEPIPLRTLIEMPPATSAVRPPAPVPGAAVVSEASAALAAVRELYRARSFDAALTRVSAARSRYPNDLGLAAEHCKVALTAGCYTAALAAADMVLAHAEAATEQKSLAHEARACALLNLGHYDEARRSCEALDDRATAAGLLAIANLHDNSEAYGDLLGILQHQPGAQACEMAVAAAYVAAKQRASLAAEHSSVQRTYQADAAAARGYAEAQGHADKPVWRSALVVGDYLFGTDAEREAARRLLRNDPNLTANPLAALVRLLPALQPSATHAEMAAALRNVGTVLNMESTWVPGHAVRVALLLRIGTAEERRVAVGMLQRRFADCPGNLSIVSLMACLHDRNGDWESMLRTLNTGIAAHMRVANAADGGLNGLGSTGAAFHATTAASHTTVLDEQLLRAHTKLHNWQMVQTLLDDRLHPVLVEALENNPQAVAPTLCVAVGDAATSLGSEMESKGNKLRARQLYSWAQQALMAALDSVPGSVELSLRAVRACIDHGRLAEPADALEIYRMGLAELEHLAVEALSQSQLEEKTLAEARLFLGLQRYDECRAALRLLKGTPLQEDADRIALIAEAAAATREEFANVQEMLEGLHVSGQKNPKLHQVITFCTERLLSNPGAPEYLAVRGAAYYEQGRHKKALGDLQQAKRGLAPNGPLYERVLRAERAANSRWDKKGSVRRCAIRAYDFARDRPLTAAAIGLGVVGLALGGDMLLTGGATAAAGAGALRAAGRGVLSGLGFTGGA